MKTNDRDDIKVISMDSLLYEKKGKRSAVTKIVEPKIPKKRVITTTDKWNFSEDELDPIQQLEYVRQIVNECEIPFQRLSTPCQFIKQQIQQKLGSYKCQDGKKNKYDELSFIKHHQVLQLMIQCENKCFYCKEPTHVLYENVREPKQWTLERIHNHIGHNETNVVIACLQCNLRRRTMHYQRYVLTKEMNIIKKI
uniref:HNH endonuclease n=1 Tax=viral metagenome TaxID=1070528 RepID=A0A6C0HU76_9ZZZZ